MVVKCPDNLIGQKIIYFDRLIQQQRLSKLRLSRSDSFTLEVMVASWFSDRFNATLTVIRRSLALVIRNTSSNPMPTVAYITESLREYSIHMLAGYAFLRRAPYVAYEKIILDSDVDPAKEEYYHSITSVAYSYHRDVMQYPPLRPHVSLLKCVYALVDKTSSKVKKPIEYHTFAIQFSALMMKYAAELASNFDKHEFTDLADYEKRRHNFAFWNPEDKKKEYVTAIKSEADLPSTHEKVLRNLKALLLRPDVPNEVVTHIFAQSLANSGLSLVGATDYPLFVPLLPQVYVNKYGIITWSKRIQDTGKSKMTALDPQDVDDSERYQFEESLSPLVADLKIYATMNLMEEYSKGDNVSPATGVKLTAAAESTTISSIAETDVPDDSDYVPDPILSFKVRDFIEHVRCMDKVPDHKDHMKRFETTSESAVSLTSWKVSRTDARVFSGENSFSPMFVITFTRKSRKPIFNPVQ